ncbi:LuxR C-terminal-related transcriptional regulator [Oryzobacter terrae]|uniref:helix-turn-helix transcriptional regulator n=1 Tax=Oryzobacter terrae TaxID=1620385 RepID=UPI00366BF46B
MTRLMLHETEQASVRAIIAAEPDPEAAPPGDVVLRHLARLVGSQSSGVVLVDPGDADLTLPLGVHRVGWYPHLDHDHHGPGAEVLLVRVRRGRHLVELWMARPDPFSAREEAIVGLVAPALERLLRAHPAAAMPLSLTVQERRVLREVAVGRSNAEVAERLFIAPCTVRKHLENAYRKLGVTNRVAAVAAVGRDAELHAVERTGTFA